MAVQLANSQVSLTLADKNAIVAMIELIHVQKPLHEQVRVLYYIWLQKLQRQSTAMQHEWSHFVKGMSGMNCLLPC